MNDSKKTCFVIQGFGKKTDLLTGRVLDLDASYDVIKEAVENAGLACIRADEIQHSEVIDKPMYERILNADLVIADLSTSNVNAAYELGVRHALRPRTTIIVAEKQWTFPFDINRNAIRTYEHLGPDLGRQEARRFSESLTADIKAILADEKAVDSPLYTYIPQLSPPFLAAAAHRSDVVLAGSEGPSVKAIADLAKAAEKQGDFVKARQLYETVHEIRPTDDSILQKIALTMYKSKEPSEEAALWAARELISTKLAPQDSNDPETLGLWAAVHKRLWQGSQDREYLEASIDALERGFKIQNDYYNGINLAYMLNERAALEGYPATEAIADVVLAKRVRQQVIGICDGAIAKGIEDPEQKYWVLATLWEAYIGVGDTAKAGQCEDQAQQVVSSNKMPDWMVETTRAQVARLQMLMAPSPLDRITG